MPSFFRLLLAMLVATALAAAQPAGSALPRGADGKPNFSGIWQAMNTANWDLQDHAARPGLVVARGAIGAEPGGLGVVVGGEIPYRPAALAQRKNNFAQRATLDPELKCYLPGVPRANYLPYPFQIFHTSRALFFAYEYAGAVRNIFLQDPGPAPTDSWMGQSVARWEGETLVIDVTALDERTWLDRSGNWHSDALHVVERYSFLTPDVLNYEATIEDHNVFSRPWKIRMPLYRHVEPNARLMEFKCVEFAEDLMYGEFSKKPKP